jgi:hypothetical protein
MNSARWIAHTPNWPSIALASAAKLARKQRPELQNPSLHRFVGDIQPALGEQILDITKAEGETKVEPHGAPDDRRRELMACKANRRHSPS